jgi:hypothetical protein
MTPEPPERPTYERRWIGCCVPVADAMAVQKYDVQRPVSDGGGYEVRFWSPLNVPVLGSDGQVGFIIHRVEDVTEFVRLQRQGSEDRQRTEELQERPAKRHPAGQQSVTSRTSRSWTSFARSASAWGAGTCLAARGTAGRAT